LRGAESLWFFREGSGKVRCVAKKVLSEGALWAQWLAARRKHPRKIVVIDAASGASWTADALTEEALRFGEVLADFRAGERIAFRVPNGVEWFALFLALQRANLAAIPLDGGWPDEGCREMAQRLGARGLYLEGKLREIGKRWRHEKGVCCIKITSGSGAAPKAVACRAGHLLADGRQILSTMKIRERDVNLGVIPPGHSYGLGNLVMPLILQGTAVVCAGEYVPRQIVEWIGRHGVTVFPGVPALFRVLASLPVKGGLAPLRTAISAGAVLAPAIAQAFYERFGRKIHNFYGASETGGICYDRTGAASLSGRSVGTPMEGVTVTIKARRVTVASGAVATRARRWRLGDFGAWNERGELMLLGRAGKGANIGGKKVHPLEVEQVLRGLPGVTEASVWLARVQGRDLLAAAVETRQAQAEIEREVAARLPTWKWPRLYMALREFPRTGRGKVDVGALRHQITLPGGGG
jgi:acyl-CoA synthetase (AMP-forming)/AMP-acid ligase II